MEPHSPKSPRFSDTPPGSPKSCMKGSRKIAFEGGGGKPTYVDVGVSASASTVTSVSGSSSSPVPSPSKRSPKSVSIRMVDAGTSSNSGGGRSTSFELQDSSSAAGPSSSSSKAPPPPEIQFQFQLTEHFDQSTPPPNCTSNGNYDFDQQQTTPSSTSTSGADPIDYEELRKDPQLIEIANKFVNDIIEKAKVEAANRQKIEEMGGRGGTAGTTSTDRDSFSNEIARGAGTWLRRAHGTVSKWFTNICVRAQNIRADLK